MDRALTSEANEPLGSRVKPGTIFQNIPSEVDRSLAPGQSTAFDLVADIEDFELPEEDAVYLVGVQIRGQVEAGGDDEIVGRGRILMPLVDEPEPQSADRGAGAPRVQVTSVVLLASRPSLVRTGVLNDDHLAEELTRAGPAAEPAERGGATGGQLRRGSGPDRGTGDDAPRLHGARRRRGDLAGHGSGGGGALAAGLRETRRARGRLPGAVRQSGPHRAGRGRAAERHRPVPRRRGRRGVHPRPAAAGHPRRRPHQRHHHDRGGSHQPEGDPGVGELRPGSGSAAGRHRGRTAGQLLSHRAQRRPGPEPSPDRGEDPAAEPRRHLADRAVPGATRRPRSA